MHHTVEKARILCLNETILDTQSHRQRHDIETDLNVSNSTCPTGSICCPVGNELNDSGRLLRVPKDIKPSDDSEDRGSKSDDSKDLPSEEQNVPQIQKESDVKFGKQNPSLVASHHLFTFSETSESVQSYPIPYSVNYHNELQTPLSRTLVAPAQSNIFHGLSNILPKSCRFPDYWQWEESADPPLRGKVSIKIVSNLGSVTQKFDNQDIDLLFNAIVNARS
ncbi:hypothetical protein QAD02_005478 [Eretmocerus hayati]|uniref:Uncharacterized protein n=1 Tax=Eretmocerus hayati TaxID=131215 RepID=A0ACC2NUC7_9HYME|nr:hypothetical protein QAD02_005478 [Eretmocerus hayati]